MTDLENRLCQLEMQVRANVVALQSDQIALSQLAQAVRTQQQGGFGGGGSGQGFIGRASANVAARSGTTDGAAVSFTIYKDVSGTLTSTGVAASARCAVSRTTVAGYGIDAGSYAWIEPDTFGDFWASPLDCT